MLLRSPGPISPDTYSGHIRRRALCPNRLRNGMSQRSSSSCQSDILPTMVGPSKSRPPMSHRKTDLGIPCRAKSAKVVLGWAVGRNLRIDHRWSQGDVARLRKDATELIALGPEVILAGVGATTPTLQQATRTVPIVMAQGIEPGGAGYVESLARPSTNITGFIQLEYRSAG